MLDKKEVKKVIEELIKKQGAQNYSRTLRNNVALFSFIKNETNFLPVNAEIKEVVWNFLNDKSEVTVCKYGRPTSFISLERGYRTFCSNGNKCICKKEHDALVNSMFQQSLTSEQRKEIENKKETTCLLNNGTRRPLQNKKIKQNQETTVKNLYGDEEYFKTDDFKQKTILTTLAERNVDHISRDPTIKKQKEQTNMKRRHVPNPSMDPAVQEKRKETFRSMDPNRRAICPSQLPKFSEVSRNSSFVSSGYYNPSQNPDVKKIKEETSMRNWNVPNPAQSPIIKDRMKKTCREMFDRDNFMQAHIPLEVYEKLENKEWLQNQGETYCAAEIARDLGIDIKVVNRYKELHDIYLKEKSSYERNMANFLTSCGINFVRNTRKILPSKLELDFYFPDYKIAIEICGVYWHSTLYKERLYHKSKMQECNHLGIRLITIFEDEWIYHKQACLEYIKNILNVNTQLRIFARKCSVEVVNFSTIKSILDENHVQYSCRPAKVSLVLKYNKEIVSVMCFSKPRENSKENDWELVRFCNNNVKVVGAAGKLLSYFIKNYNPEKITSFADARWSQGDVYYKLGFINEEIIDCDYRYVKDKKTFHKFGFSKNQLVKKGFDVTGKTEKQVMEQAGYLRIYDCGKYRFVWTNPTKVI